MDKMVVSRATPKRDVKRSRCLVPQGVAIFSEYIPGRMKEDKGDEDGASHAKATSALRRSSRSYGDFFPQRQEPATIES